MSREILEVAPQLWMQFMRAGAFEEAWKISDIVLQANAGKPNGHLPRHLQRIWDGTPLAGKRVLIRCYHGLGDTIQFIRYIPLVKAIATTVIVWAQEPLLPLLQSLPDIDLLLPLHNDIPQIEYEVDVEIMELPYIFRTILSTIPAKTPYLFIKTKQLPKHNTALHVGLVWKSGNWDERRSIPFHLLQPIFYIQNITFYILQQDASSAGWKEEIGIYPGDFELWQFAQIINGLDLLITVDSMPAHLAGALGKPVWTLLHADADWRWMENRADSPWYPTMRLFRQQQQGEWAPVIAQVAQQLEQFSKMVH